VNANDDAPEGLPSHIEHGVQATAEVHAEHERSATPYDLAVDMVTAAIGKPLVVALFAILVAVWISANLLLPQRQRFDPPPFGVLATIASVAALTMTVLILTTQRRADRLMEKREQLILQLSIVNEKKNSKIIEMLQHLRRDHPEIVDNVDPEATAMMQTTSPSQVLGKLNESTENLRR